MHRLSHQLLCPIWTTISGIKEFLSGSASFSQFKFLQLNCPLTLHWDAGSTRSSMLHYCWITQQQEHFGDSNVPFIASSHEQNCYVNKPGVAACQKRTPNLQRRIKTHGEKSFYSASSQSFTDACFSYTVID